MKGSPSCDPRPGGGAGPFGGSEARDHEPKADEGPARSGISASAVRGPDEARGILKRTAPHHPECVGLQVMRVHQGAGVRRYSRAPLLSNRRAIIVVGSKPNGLPAGLALHAELRALESAGLTAAAVLQATGHRAAEALGLQSQIGSIAPGALADLVLVAGDPLVNVADALNIVAVIRNGRFFSQISLLERAQAAASVE